jgi:hypothetical protein
MTQPYRKLFFICLGGLVLRLIVLPFIQHPGIGDPNHYYNLGVQLVNGQGFNVDYIWQYNHPPESIVHPDDHWMPLAGILAGVSMKLFGIGVYTSLIPFILIGTLIPLVAYWAARQLECGENASLFAAAAAAALPEFVLNSVRTDTTIPNVMLACLSILLLTRGLKKGSIPAFIGSGVTAGLTYMTRNDGALLIPMMVVTLAIYWKWGRGDYPAPRWRYAALMPLFALMVVLPWTLRNLHEFGTLTSPGLNGMFFFTEQRDHYAYGRTFTLQTMLASQTIPQIIGKRLFELAAAFKLMYTTLDMLLPVAVMGGLLFIIRARDRERWLTLVPTLILLAIVLVAYPILIPYKSQSGSFKKAYLTIIPLLIPLGAYAVERAITDRRIQAGAMILTIGFMSANAFELVRADAHFTNTYLETMRKTAAVVQTLPDTNDDGQLILMAQDQFMLRFFGIRSVMLPMEDRATILAVAQRYHVDYLMMPPDRPSLDLVYFGEEKDARFVHIADVHGTNVMIYGFKFDARP